ncbi:MAG: TetR/AcrR family transcriptional regulator [Candidatus Parvarchaeota archaeon]
MRIPKTKRGMVTKNKLLNAAEKIFGAKGYAESTITEITQKAKVGMGTFYNYYNSKSEIFADLVRMLNHDLRKSISISVQNLGTRREIEEKGFRTFFDFLKHHKNLYRIIRQAEYVKPELFRWYYDKISTGYAEGLKKAMESGEIREMDPELLSYVLMGIGDFIGMKYILWNDELNDKMMDQVMNFIFSGILVRKGHEPC